MRRTSSLAALLVAASPAMATDIQITPLKLIIVNKPLFSTAKVVFVAKDPNIAKGAGTNPGDIESELDITGTTGPGSFVNMSGSNWLANRSTVAKYVNKEAPDADGSTKVSVIKPAKLIKNVGKSLGDSPVDISAAPAGEVHVVYTVVNGGETFRHCGKFTSCSWRTIADDSGQKLVCKGTGTVDTCPGTTTTTAPPTTTTLPALSHFWGYEASGFGTLDPSAVTVQDQFIGPVMVDPSPAAGLFVPVDKNGEGIPNPVDYLSYHAFDDGAGYYLTIPGPATGVEVTNQFGTVSLPLGPAVAFLVPTEAFPGSTPIAPQVDHFVCYFVNPYVFVPVSIPVTLTDQFQTDSPTLQEIQAFCAPADTNGEGVLNATEHLVWYSYAQEGVAPGLVPIRNQFGDDTLDLVQPSVLLVPSTKVGWCGNGVLEGSETCETTAPCPGAEVCSATCACGSPSGAFVDP